MIEDGPYNIQQRNQRGKWKDIVPGYITLKIAIKRADLFKEENPEEDYRVFNTETNSVVHETNGRTHEEV